MERDLELIRDVRRLLADEGFGLAENGSEGLFLRPEPRGLWLRWQRRELLRPIFQLHGDAADLASRAEVAGIQAAIHIALTVLLRSAGYKVSEQDEGWLLVTRPPDAA
ncbi:hypothetical protein [Streptomyces sp. A0592]|uniref:hypothetical protein n=1 Tax=Streptomyces sp. A0592 TaxID=2563099 RepID=UPI00109E3828|nr:hypothetical protein [Streptomyces sp. A0592]THA74150.1 hypothetical protein E6U81_38400 [Streptomyces sp. A0592]